MEEIHLDTSGPAAAPTAFYYNKTLSAPLSSPLAPPRPPSKNNGSGPGNGNGSNNNRHRNRNRCNGGSGGKNSDNGGNRGGNTSSNTTATGAYDHVPRPVAHWPATVAGFHGHDGALHPTRLCPRVAVVVQAGPSCTSSGLGTLELLQHHGATVAPQLNQ
jgi:hypothetical protein